VGSRYSQCHDESMDSHVPPSPFCNVRINGLTAMCGKSFFNVRTVNAYRFILILEVKNITGTLYFDQLHHQLIRTTTDQEEAFPDPILQTRRHRLQLKSWINTHQIPAIPITSLVVISNPTSKNQSHPRGLIMLINTKLMNLTNFLLCLSAAAFYPHRTR
jgi:hypothetical protein